MNTDIYTKILEDHKELASLPQTLAEVIRVTRDDTSSAQDLAEVLGRDPALTAKVLRVVNSPYYGAGREITTLTQAVVMLGLRTVSALALSTSIYDITGKWQSSIDRIRFWRHSLEVAIASRLIAEAVRYPRPEEAFVSGLLHDLGLLVLEKSFKDRYESIWRSAVCGEELVDMEENTWGTNHARIGQFLLDQWGIPSLISEAVGQHHRSFPPDLNEPELRLPQIVALANRISKFSVAKTKVDFESQFDSTEILRKNLQLPGDRLKPIEEQLMSHTVEQARFLEIDIGSTEEILVEANLMLYHHYNAAENLLKENNQMHREITQTQMEKAALESLKTITATFNHYINNAAATILGRAQLIELGMKRGEIVDSQNKTTHALDVIINGVNTIQLVLEELKNLESYETAVYHDETRIIDIENRVRKQLEKLRSAAQSQLPA
ncbi:MAG: HDOD domain-containing protein [Candidatus Zixiibacteriota bacterium]|nr:MAG: HDOD domain-containing protein [candidate division Zixibacteria bacterium]